MKFKNSSTVRVIAAFFVMLMLYSCGNNNSPTATNELQKTDLSTSKIQSSSLSKSNHKPDGLAAQSSPDINIATLTPSDGVILYVPSGPGSGINLSWSTTVTYTVHTYTNTLWTDLKVWIDGEKVYDVKSYWQLEMRTVTGTKTLLPGVHTIKVEAKHSIYGNGQSETHDAEPREHEFTVVDPTPPPPKPFVTATTQSGHPKLTWGPASGAVRYKLTKVENGASPVTWTQTSRTYTDWSENAIPTVLGNLMYKVQGVNSEGQAGPLAVKFYTTF